MSKFSSQQTSGPATTAADLSGEVRDVDGVPGADGGKTDRGDFWKLPEPDGAAESS